MATILLLLIVLPIITVLPGAWVAFGLPLGRLSAPARLAIAVALTPAVLGAEYLVLTLLGVSFPLAAWVLLLVNLPSAVLLSRAEWQRPTLRPALRPGMGLALLGALMLALIIPWLALPTMRMYSWHALLHSSIIYRVSAGPGLPEEPELAGLSLAYPWLGHVYWAVLGTVTDVAPTLLYPLSNLIWLATGFALAYVVAREGFELGPASAAFGAGFTFLATQSVAFAAKVATWDIGLATEYFGFRIGTILEKYRGFEVMPFAFALLLALLLAVVVSLRKEVNLAAFALLEAAILVAVGMVYTVMAAVGFVLVGGQILLLATRWGSGYVRRSWREIGQLTSAAAMAFAVCVALYWLYSLSTRGTIPLGWAGVKTRLYQTIFALLPFAVVGFPALWRAVRQRDAVVLLLAATAGAACVMHLFMRLGDNEYKFVLFASVCLAPLCALTVDRWLTQPGARRERWAWPVVMGVPLLLLAIDLTAVFGVGIFMQAPWRTATPLDESHYQVALESGQPDAGWVAAVRDQTPKNTVVVARDLPFYAPALVDRALFAPADRNGEQSPGYSLNNRFQLISQRRYAGALHDTREVAEEALLQGCATEKMAEAVSAIEQLERPVALVFDNPRACGLAYVQQAGTGEQLYADAGHVVWLIEQDAATGQGGVTGG